MNKIVDDKLLEAKKLSLRNPEKSYEIAKSSLALTVNDHEVARCYFHMAYACRVMSNYTEGLKHAMYALDLFEKASDEYWILRTRNIIGIVYFYYGNYKTALEYFSKILVHRDLMDAKLLSSVLNNIGEVYREAGNHDKALDYFHEAMDISDKNKLMDHVAAISLNIGEVYYITENEKSDDFVQRAYELGVLHGDLVVQGEAETKLGRSMFRNRKYDLAEKYYKSALEKFNKVNNKYYLIDLLINYAALLEAKGKPPRKYLIEALNCSIQTKLENKVCTIYKLLSEYYERNNDFREAFAYMKAYHLKDKEIEASNLSVRLEIMSIELNASRQKDEGEDLKLMGRRLKREIESVKEELEAIKLENKALLEVSLYDELTKVYNRRGMFKYLEEVEKTDKKDVLLILDIDYFKKYNDSWGHLKGDACLVDMVNCISSHNFEDFAVGRYGGEEFICYFKADDIDEARNTLELIREKCQSLKKVYYSEGEKFITVSIGAVITHLDKHPLMSVLDEADQQLYLAKESGRNLCKIKEY
ncbi:GGDEF domain-containing protein [Acidaminobacter sp. JC074]|uniref:GGDEF domain-containing protein n=1 Tax=Acidaminobacter sp. JC074 TaxID=2530199 RepID=UPI001F0E64B1|nr:tetratricopeptide repeat-containing diguanylate cyclase [Acidaminobacter sp. JC074]MCH4888536.1 GGDEF domain-containing protein [Acidaminobacter sp. JC074]